MEASMFGIVKLSRNTVGLWKKVDFSDINNPDDLLVEAKKYLAKRVKPTVSIELTAVDGSLLDADIQAFRLGDLVPLTSDIHGVSSTIGDVNTYYPISKIRVTRKSD